MGRNPAVNDVLCICRDEDCPECGWPETYAEFGAGPMVIGCRKCGWRDDAPLARLEGYIP
jgi:hypothetical protein